MLLTVVLVAGFVWLVINVSMEIVCWIAKRGGQTVVVIDALILRQMKVIAVCVASLVRLVINASMEYVWSIAKRVGQTALVNVSILRQMKLIAVVVAIIVLQGIIVVMVSVYQIDQSFNCFRADLVVRVVIQIFITRTV